MLIMGLVEYCARVLDSDGLLNTAPMTVHSLKFDRQWVKLHIGNSHYTGTCGW